MSGVNARPYPLIVVLFTKNGRLYYIITLKASNVISRVKLIFFGKSKSMTNV